MPNMVGREKGPKDIGTFGANEFEEALLTGSTMRRFQPNDEAADEAADEDEGGT